MFSMHIYIWTNCRCMADNKILHVALGGIKYLPLHAQYIEPLYMKPGPYIYIYSHDYKVSSVQVA